MNEVTSPTRFSSPAGGRTDAGDRSARGLDKLRRLLERECEAQVGGRVAIGCRGKVAVCFLRTWWVRACRNMR